MLVQPMLVWVLRVQSSTKRGNTASQVEDVVRRESIATTRAEFRAVHAITVVVAGSE